MLGLAVVASLSTLPVLASRAVTAAASSGILSRQAPASRPVWHLSGHAAAVSYGLDVNQFDSDIGPQRIPAVLALADQAGAGVVRFGPGGGWQAIEAGGQGQDNWSTFDANLASAYANHLSVLLEMGNEPGWDAPFGNTAAPPADCIGWSPSSPSSWCSSVTTWVDDLVNHLLTTPVASSSPPEVEISEVAGLIPRNEPQNYAMNWVDPASGGPVQWAVDYAHFQQTVYEAAHSTVSAYDAAHGTSYSLAVMNGGEELASPSNRVYSRPFVNGSPTYSENAETMLETLYSTPAFCDSIDVFDFHVGDHGPLWSVKMVDLSEAALEQCDGGRHLPIWVSEAGYTSVPQIQSLPQYAAELGGAYEGGQIGQARYLYDTVTALASDPNVVGVDWTFVVDPNTSSLSAGGTLDTLHNTGAGLGLWASNEDS